MFHLSIRLTFLLSCCFLAAFGQQTDVQYLSGVDKDHTVPWEFQCTGGRNSGQWTKIAVPSCWELQGFGTYSYGGQDWGKQPNEKGLYRHPFSVPAAWKNKKIFLVFEGSMTDTEAKINGQSAGPMHQGAFYRFKYDVTKLVKLGKENILEVTVSKNSANESINRAERYADFWIFGGIFRPVYLEAVPEQFIERNAIDARADGSFKMDVFLNGITKGNVVEAQITTLSGEPVGQSFQVPVAAKQEKVTLQTHVANPSLWTSEFPNLYRVELKLKNGANTLHTIQTRFGFRTLELRKGDGFYVNGAKIRFKGVNRHSFWPTSGRTTSKELSITDVNLIKEMNMNSVRMSHYPPDQHFLDVCDSLGLFVLDELTGWQKAYDTTVARRLVKELIVRDVNHPSIVIWDNGNEGGNNHAVVDDYAIYDPQNRTVIHPWAVFRGTDTQHYKPYDCCENDHTMFHGKDVFFPTEFLHGLYDGGIGAGIEDYWNLMLKNPLSAGGFFWVFSDESVVRSDKDGVLDSHGNYAPDGIVGPYREKEGSFFTVREVWSPVFVEAPSLSTSFTGKLTVENRYHFTNLNQCRFEWKLSRLPAPNDRTTKAKEVKTGTSSAPNLAPAQRGTLELALPSDWRTYEALSLTATDPHGKEIFTWSWPVQAAEAIARRISGPVSGKAKGKEEKDLVTLSANGVSISFSKKTGALQEVKNAKTALSFTNGPVLAAGKAEFKKFKHYTEGNDYVVEATYEGNLKKVTWRLLGNGWLRLDYAYQPDSGKYDNLGISFDYPEEKVTGVRYLGQGPYRVWKNRMKGPTFGVWEKEYNNTVTGESEFKYPEFKGYHANCYWAVIETKESDFTIVSGTDDLFLRLFTPLKPQGAKNDNTSPPFPGGSISLLHAITPIGTKFTRASAGGPQGQQTLVELNSAPKTGVLYFDFSSK